MHLSEHLLSATVCAKGNAQAQSRVGQEKEWTLRYRENVPRGKLTRSCLVEQEHDLYPLILGHWWNRLKCWGRQSLVSLSLSGVEMTGQSRPVCKSRRELEWSVCCGAKTTEARSQGLRASLGEKPGECRVRTERAGGKVGGRVNQPTWHLSCWAAERRKTDTEVALSPGAEWLIPNLNNLFAFKCFILKL